MAVSLDLRRWVACVVDDDLLGGDHDVDGTPIGLDVELPVWTAKAEQVEGGEVARAVVEEHELTARIARIDATRVGARVPVVDGRVKLHPRVTADVCGFGDLLHQVTSPVGVSHLAAQYVAGLPFAVLLNGLHEGIRDANGVIGVLEEHGSVRLAVETAVVARVDQGPGLFLFACLGFDELHDVGMVDVQNDHLGRAPGLAAGFDDTCEGVEPAHEGHRT